MHGIFRGAPELTLPASLRLEPDREGFTREGESMMHCPHCRSPMLIVEHVDQPRSAQTWYQCPACDVRRLVSVDKTRYRPIGGLQPVSTYPAFFRGDGT
jgi:DNA-directed RNA polymerase subunit RPC12/RpoP